MTTQPTTNADDELDKLLIGFANELLAYRDRMDKADSETLFIYDYVRRRRKRFNVYILNLLSTTRTNTIQTAIEAVPEKKPDEFIHVSHFEHEKSCIPGLTFHAACTGHNLAIDQTKAALEALKGE